MKTIDSKLLAEFKKGDHASFERIFESYSHSLFQFSFSYLKSKEAAEDVVQEVFLKIWDNRQEIRNDTSFRSYLFTIALNAVRKQFNKLSKVNEIKHGILFELSAQKSDFDDRNDYQELLDTLHKLIGKMPEKRRQVFIKKKLEEKSLKEIAGELQIDPKTVEYHITEAMKFLKEEFEKLRVKGMIFFHLFLGGK
jgi:RNA polymerase sigma-70 factor (ECF subfamily)